MEEVIVAPRPRGRPPLNRPVERQLERETGFGTRFLVTSPVSRFTLADWPVWGEWLFMRLDTQWPGYSQGYWKNKLAIYAGSNDYLFVKNDDSLLLYEARVHPMDGKPRGFEIFAWSRHAEKMGAKRYGVQHRSDAQYSLLALYRFAAEWLKGKGATYGLVGDCSDCAYAGLKESLKGEDADWIVFK